MNASTTYLQFTPLNSICYDHRDNLQVPRIYFEYVYFKFTYWSYNDVHTVLRVVRGYAIFVPSEIGSNNTFISIFGRS